MTADTLANLAQGVPVSAECLAHQSVARTGSSLSQQLVEARAHGKSLRSRQVVGVSILLQRDADFGSESTRSMHDRSGRWLLASAGAHEIGEAAACSAHVGIERSPDVVERKE